MGSMMDGMMGDLCGGSVIVLLVIIVVLLARGRKRP